MRGDPRQTAVLLRDDSVGVATEHTARSIQENGRDRSFHVSLNPDWLEQLNLGQQGERTVHSMSLGQRPVVVQQPAIIVQPEAVLNAEVYDTDG